MRALGPVLAYLVCAGQSRGTHATVRQEALGGFKELLVALNPVTAYTTQSAPGGRARREKEKEKKPKIPVAENAAVWHARLMSVTPYKPRFEALPLSFVHREPDQKLTASLALHAEKKAFSDILRREGHHWGEKGKQGWHKMELRLDINFHVCVDCHDYFKAASLLLARDIWVREPKMTHHFHKGWCTCNDLWRWEERARKRRVEEGSEQPRGFNVR
mmetsp:Transcript_43746/g.82032  ORF Transcript_43746/g.82032 Transcript_43746/m.82032 type:complete len:217 (+) Transcript_43746:56-706(+)